MTLLAGEVVTADRLARLQSTVWRIISDDNLTLTTTETDIPGASVTVTTVADDAVYTVVGVFDMDTSSTGGGILQGRLEVAGVTQTEEAHGRGETTGRDTNVMTWNGTLGAAGEHVFTLRGQRTGASGTQIIRAVHTNAIVTIYEVV